MTYKDVDDYIDKAPPEVQMMLRQIRTIIKESAPEAEEKISYGMPYYGYHGRLIYFAGYKEYLGLYVMSEARLALQDELEKYRTSKATYKFPVGKPLPAALIKKVITTQAAANKKG